MCVALLLIEDRIKKKIDHKSPKSGVIRKLKHDAMDWMDRNSHEAIDWQLMANASPFSIHMFVVVDERSKTTKITCMRISVSSDRSVGRSVGMID